MCNDQDLVPARTERPRDGSLALLRQPSLTCGGYPVHNAQDWAAEAQSLFAVVSLTVTSVLAWLTYYYARLAHSLVAEAASEREDRRTDRLRQVEQTRSRLDLEQVRVVAVRHAYREQANVQHTPGEQGEIVAALDSLPADRLPHTRRLYHPATGRQSHTNDPDTYQARWEQVRRELEAELLWLTRRAAGQHSDEVAVSDSRGIPADPETPRSRP